VSQRAGVSDRTSDPRALWLLDPDVIFLNHGSFGACPRVVLDVQTGLRERLEREPVLFLARDLEGLLDESRQVLGSFLGADPEGIAFVPNATTGVNTVLRSLHLRHGDEILTTDHAYPACKNALNSLAGEVGVVVVEAEIPFPIVSPKEVVDSLAARVGPRTRVCLIDHVTSPTGLVFPVATIVTRLQDMGVDVIVDGAHAPGMLPIAVDAIGAAYYTGNCHKWLCAPKGSGFLYVRPDKRESIRPLVVSLGYGSGRTDRAPFRLQFDWVGTADPTPYLCVAEAIRYMGSLLPGGWSDLMVLNRKAALEARTKLCDALRTGPPCPNEMIGSLASVPLPDGLDMDYSHTGDNDPIHTELLDRHGIEVPVIAWPRPPKRLIRLSAQIYNKPQEYEDLVDALGAILAQGRRAGA
jgi:isopenicillin-N epimerase